MSLGGGTLFVAQAASGPSSAVVTIDPVRVLDSRDGNDIGLAGPFVSAVGLDLHLTGPIQTTSGTQTVVPDGATGVILNVTVVAPTANGFVSVRPADAPGSPTTSNLNFRAGDVVPNAVTVQLPTSGADKGRIEITYDAFAIAGPTTDILIDVVGYLVEGAAGPQGDPGPQGDQGPAGQDGSANRITDEQIALLQWWQDPGAPATYSGFVNPWAAATDGANIWVVNSNFPTGSVSRLDPATGTKVDYPVGGLPTAIAFDGANMWVANELTDNVSRVNATTGAKVDFTAGDGPAGIAFDGTSIWIANSADDTVSKMDPTIGSKVDYPTGDKPTAVVFDGQFVWVANQSSSDVWKINPATGAKVADYPSGSGFGQPRAMVFDGADLWVSNVADFSVSRIDPATGSKTDFPVPFAPFGLAYDGSHIWVANSGDPGTVSKMDPVLGTTVEYPTGTFPTGVAFDGTNIWVASAGEGSLTKLLPGS